MKIVIDIDENTYNRIISGFVNEDDAGLFEKLFKDGTPEQTRWIPVKERMPNFNDIVLASTKYYYTDSDELRVIITVYNAEEYWFDGTITAWMPLPEPYKESEEEQK